jgi:hypothetical protein
MHFSPQATAQAPAPAAPPPAAPPPPAQAPAQAPIEITQTGNDLVGRILSPREIEALRDARTELSNQLLSATGRRDEFVEQLQSASGVNRAGLEERIKLLDSRILNIEGEIARTGQQLTNSLAASQEGELPFGGMRPDFTAISIVFTVFVLAPIALAMARSIWKRATHTKPAPSTFEKENADRMERLEQAVESIAIEVERVSEGQRFVTKLLAESHERARLEVKRG